VNIKGERNNYVNTLQNYRDLLQLTYTNMVYFYGVLYSNAYPSKAQANIQVQQSRTNFQNLVGELDKSYLSYLTTSSINYRNRTAYFTTSPYLSCMDNK